MKKRKIISIGGGWVVNNRHIYALQQSGHFDVIGVLSKDEERAQSTAKKFGIPHHGTEIDFTSGWQAEAEAVMIGTVPHAHYEVAKAALLAGKHVLTEKPMTVELEHATELAELAKEKKLVLALVHNFQYSRAAQQLRTDLATGKLGKIRSVYGVQLCNHERNIPDWCDKLPLGLFYDEAPHFYYLFRWITAGNMELQNATVWKAETTQNTPRAVSAEYKSAGGFPTFLHINFDSSLTEWHVTVIGEKGTVDVDVWRDIYSFLPNDGSHTARDILRTSIVGAAYHFWGVLTGGIRYFRKKHLYGNDEIVDRFHRAIEGEDSLQGMDPAEGRGVIALMHELISKATYYG